MSNIISTNHDMVYLNGDFMPMDSAKISVMDRGFLFGDGVYEVIPVFKGELFGFKEHMARLQYSLDEVNIPFSVDGEHLLKVFKKLLTEEDSAQQQVYVQVTRGIFQSRDHAYVEEDISPTIFIYTKSVPPLEIDILSAGGKAITLEDIRWSRCDIKSISLIANVLMRQIAKQQNAVEAILIRDDKVIEGAASNVFIVKDNWIITPPLSGKMLSGITREMILQIAKDDDLPFREAEITLSELYAADEIWVTSSSMHIFPITRVDDREINHGKVGEVWRKVIAYYRQYSSLASPKGL